MSKNIVTIDKKIDKFKKKITVDGDKSISIRWVLLSSLSDEVCQAKNLLMSEDVLASIRAVRKLGTKVTFKKKNL